MLVISRELEVVALVRHAKGDSAHATPGVELLVGPRAIHRTFSLVSPRAANSALDSFFPVFREDPCPRRLPLAPPLPGQRRPLISFRLPRNPRNWSTSAWLQHKALLASTTASQLGTGSSWHERSAARQLLKRLVFFRELQPVSEEIAGILDARQLPIGMGAVREIANAGLGRHGAAGDRARV